MTATPSVPPATSASQRIARLRVKYLEQLPARLQQIEQLAQALQDSPYLEIEPLQELHRLLHSVKGTGRSFGFEAIGHSAGAGEAVLQAAVDSGIATDLAPDWRSGLATYVDALRQAVTQALQPQKEEADAGAKQERGGASLALSASQLSGVVQSGRRGGRLVYICDDEAVLLEQLSTQLSCFGYQTRCFTDPQTLMAALDIQRPDAVLMDIQFPQGRSAGIEVLQKVVKETGQPLPAIFLSSRHDFEARLGAVRAGGQAYFTKPVRVNDLVATLDQLTRQNQTEAFRVLIIDDDPEVAHYHAILLQEAGMATQELYDPRQALEVLDSFRPDLVLMDMYMPHCSGHEVASVIRQESQHVGLPIVYLTSETDKEKLFSAMRIGAEGFITKPVHPQQLVAAVAIRAERMRTLRMLMARDSLTGLFNHTMTTQLLENAISLARRNAETVSFVMLDLDRFKLVNDTYGHPMGDQVLLALSRLLQQRLRNTDIVGRYGGEEFAIILHHTSPEEAYHLIDALREDFSRVVFYSDSEQFQCSFSAGIASFPTYQRLEQLREMADRALYKSKHQGRNCVVLSTEVFEE